MGTDDQEFEQLETRVSRNRPSSDGVDFTLWLFRGVLGVAAMILLGFLIIKSFVWLTADDTPREPYKPAEIQWGK